MPKVAKGRRKRAYRPKTSSGCVTCRVRRVKCDETHPQCLNCSSTGRQCDGYDAVRQITYQTRVPVTVIVDPSGDIHTCPRSRRSFAFFAQRTRPELAGFFGSEFWERLILQAAHHEPAIRYALIAIGSLHEQKTVTGDLEEGFALEQYNLAIRSLMAPLAQNGERAVDVCLILCLLFTCFENMQGHHISAGQHIRSGSKLLQEAFLSHRGDALQQEASGLQHQPNFYIQLDVLARMFAGLDTEVAMTVQMYSPKKYDTYFSGIDQWNNSSLIFSSVQEAKNLFEYGRSILISSLETSKQPRLDTASHSNAVPSHVSDFKILITKFAHALNIFADTRTSVLTPQEDIAIAALQLHVMNTYVVFCLQDQPLIAEACQKEELIQHMEHIVRLGEKLISSLSSNEGCKPQTPSFCLDLGFIIPLFTVASQCPDTELRQTAIALLRSTPRQEGLWNSEVVAKAAERILEIEEEQGTQLRACAGNERDMATFLKLPTVLQLDGAGVRLQFVKPGVGSDAHVTMVEQVFHW